MNLNELSLAELHGLMQDVPLEIKRRETVEKAKVLEEFRALAKARGFNFEELFGKEAKAKVATGGKVKVKYRHPLNAELEWTGRGRKPKWVEAWVADGGSIDDLLV